MNFDRLVENLLSDIQLSLPTFRPELILAGTIIVLLLLKMLFPRWPGLAYLAMLGGIGTAFWALAPWRLESPAGVPAIETFTGMLVADPFSVYFRALLFVFLFLLVLLIWISRPLPREDAAEFSVLLLGATIGMCLMVSANHLLIVFLGVEMASVPSYALSGVLRNRRPSSEAALKFAVYGGGTAGIMLYGISLLAGVLGTVHLPTMAVRLSSLLQSGAGSEHALILVLGGLLVMVGIAFKLSAVPFHFWAPDVFEGAPAEVAAFLSVASKAAALALLVRMGLALTTAADATMMATLEPARQFLGGLVAFLAAITCTFGNLAAYGQTNMKRLLAYSTIAHAGYMMMAIAATLLLAGHDPQSARTAVATLAFYLAVYLFMNLGAFTAVAILRNASGSELIESYTGLARRSPGVTLAFAVILFSLFGLPPLAGFAGKFAVFSSLARAQAPLLTLLVIGTLNTVLSLFYYLRVVKVMTLASEAEGQPAPRIPLTSARGLYFAAITLPVLVLGIWWNGLFTWAAAAASKLIAS